MAKILFVEDEKALCDVVLYWLESQQYVVEHVDNGNAATKRRRGLLEFPFRHRSQVFSADALIERIWPTDSEASANAIKTYVNRLRGKIDSKNQPSLISTVHGIGYRLDLLAMLPHLPVTNREPCLPIR